MPHEACYRRVQASGPFVFGDSFPGLGDRTAVLVAKDLSGGELVDHGYVRNDRQLCVAVTNEVRQRLMLGNVLAEAMRQPSCTVPLPGATMPFADQVGAACIPVSISVMAHCLSAISLRRRLREARPCRDTVIRYYRPAVRRHPSIRRSCAAGAQKVRSSAVEMPPPPSAVRKSGVSLVA